MPTQSISQMPRQQRVSRAVVRDIDAGSSVNCAHCGERVKFQAKNRGKQVICNVYVKGKWKRVEHFHYACYSDAREPHGEPTSGTDYRREAARAAAGERAKLLSAEAEASRQLLTAAG